jgi:hypothetical protein
MNAMWTTNKQDRDTFILKTRPAVEQEVQHHANRYGQPSSCDDFAQEASLRLLEAMQPEVQVTAKLKHVFEADTPQEAAERAGHAYVLKEVTRTLARKESRRAHRSPLLANPSEISFSVLPDKARELVEFLTHFFDNVLAPAHLTTCRHTAAVMESSRTCGAKDLNDDDLALVAHAGGVNAEELRRYVNKEKVEAVERKAWQRAKDELLECDRAKPRLKEVILRGTIVLMLTLTTWHDAAAKMFPISREHQQSFHQLS